MTLKVLDLFSGIGGFSLGLESTGYFETVAFCEKDEFCKKVLQKHWGDIKVYDNIRSVDDGLQADVVTGGFPCQSFSQAGLQKGRADDRFLWNEMFDVIKQVKPRWVIGENVQGIINIEQGMVLKQVQDDLESEGFQVQCFLIPASGIGAWHQRKRVWILANSNSIRHRKGDSERCKNEEWSFLPREQEGGEVGSKTSRCSNVSDTSGKRYVGHDFKQSKHDQKFRQFANKNDENRSRTQGSRKKDVPDTCIKRSQGHRVSTKLEKKQGHFSTKTSFKEQQTWWETESRICGVPDGVSYGVDRDRAKRIKALGNSIVPQIARQLGLAIMEAENES
jgi:DNA (cytosine-5)-methyltransferase 1